MNHVSHTDSRVRRYRHSGPGQRRPGRLAVVGLLTAAVALLVTAGVYAGLDASATAAGSVGSGTLDLTVGPDVGAGFSTFVGRMAPGDTHNVFVTLDNTGTLASVAGMRLTVTGAPSNPLVNGTAAGEGLTVTLTRCSVAWNLATGACPGTTTRLLAATRVSAVPAGGVALANVPALAALTGTVAHVRVRVGLVATETSTNGVPPPLTVQGESTTLTFGFTEVQRTGISTSQ